MIVDNGHLYCTEKIMFNRPSYQKKILNSFQDSLTGSEAFPVEKGRIFYSSSFYPFSISFLSFCDPILFLSFLGFQLRGANFSEQHANIFWLPQLKSLSPQWNWKNRSSSKEFSLSAKKKGSTQLLQNPISLLLFYTKLRNHPSVNLTPN